MNIGENPELNAVNEMLAAIGESPLSSLDLMPPSGHTARAILHQTSQAIQLEGHWFNQEDNYTLSPGPDGEVAVPANVLNIDAFDASQDVVQRGSRLYDRGNGTYSLSAPVVCSVTLLLPWEELPAVARWYITATATERFCEAFPGSPGVTDARDRNLRRALAAFRTAEAENGDYNVLNNTSIRQQLRRS